MLGKQNQWLLLLAVALALLIPACTKRNEDDPDRRPGPSSVAIPTNVREGSVTGRGVSPSVGPPMTFQYPTLTNVQEILATSNSAALLSQQVDLKGVKVQRVLSSQYVLIGPEPNQVVVVRLKELLPNLKPGQTISVGGMIAQLGEDLSHWELDPENKKLISHHPIFINASRSDPDEP